MYIIRHGEDSKPHATLFHFVIQVSFPQSSPSSEASLLLCWTGALLDQPNILQKVELPSSTAHHCCPPAILTVHTKRSPLLRPNHNLGATHLYQCRNSPTRISQPHSREDTPYSTSG